MLQREPEHGSLSSRTVKEEVSQSEQLLQQSLSRMEKNHVLLPAPDLPRLSPQPWDGAFGGSELLAGFQMWPGTDGSAQAQVASKSSSF